MQLNERDASSQQQLRSPLYASQLLAEDKHREQCSHESLGLIADLEHHSIDIGQSDIQSDGFRGVTQVKLFAITESDS